MSEDVKCGESIAHWAYFPTTKGADVVTPVEGWPNKSWPEFNV